jgi:DNA polymerase III subunit delta'
MSWDLIGHDLITERLRRDIAQDRVRHAYLFTGPAGIGKRTLVAEFARALLCAQPDPPCGQCRNCTLALKGSHPDRLIVEPVVSGKKVLAGKITIDPVRQLIRAVQLKPVEASRRVACLLRFDAANSESQNAFLKTLEEPPGQVVLLLTAERADDLLPTIVSRCEVVALRPVPREVVRDALITRWLVPAERAALLANLSQGRLGWAVRMQQDEAALEARARKLDDLAALVAGTRAVRFAYAERLAKDGSVDRIQETLDLWLAFWRDVLLVASGAAAPGTDSALCLANPDREADIRRLAQAVTPEAASQVMRGLRRTGELLEKNANARLALEVCLLDWPRL